MYLNLNLPHYRWVCKNEQNVFKKCPVQLQLWHNKSLRLQSYHTLLGANLTEHNGIYFWVDTHRIGLSNDLGLKILSASKPSVISLSKEAFSLVLSIPQNSVQDPMYNNVIYLSLDSSHDDCSWPWGWGCSVLSYLLFSRDLALRKLVFTNCCRNFLIFEEFMHHTRWLITSYHPSINQKMNYDLWI